MRSGNSLGPRDGTQSSDFSSLCVYIVNGNVSVTDAGKDDPYRRRILHVRVSRVSHQVVDGQTREIIIIIRRLSRLQYLW